MTRKPLYLALIGDLVGSRETKNRAELQRRLAEEMARLSLLWAGEFASNLAFTAGDEMQALFRWPFLQEDPIRGRRIADAIVDVVIRIAAVVHPMRICFGLGGGGLSTDLQPESPAAMDGPCFHAARAALGLSKGEDRLLTTCGLAREPEGKKILTIEDIAPTAVFGLLGALLSEWTSRQVEIALDPERGLTELRQEKASEEENPFASRMRKEVAQNFNVSPSVVTEGMRAARYDQFRFGLWAAGVLLWDGAKLRWERQNGTA